MEKDDRSHEYQRISERCDREGDREWHARDSGVPAQCRYDEQRKTSDKTHVMDLGHDEAQRFGASQRNRTEYVETRFNDQLRGRKEHDSNQDKAYAGETDGASSLV